MTTQTELDNELHADQLIYDEFNKQLLVDKDILSNEMAQLLPTEELLHLYAIKYERLLNKQNIAFSMRQVTGMKLYKKYIHLKIPEQLADISLEYADEIIKEQEGFIKICTDFDYDNITKTTRNISFFFNRPIN